MRVLIVVLLFGTALGNEKPKNTADPRLKLKPHKWTTSSEDLQSLKNAAPTKGTWAEPIFGKTEEKVPDAAAAALQAREAAKTREQARTQKTTSTTVKPAAKKPIATTTTTTTTTTTAKAHKYWKPNDETKEATATSTTKTKAPVAPAVVNASAVVNLHSTKKAQIGSGAPSGPAAAMMTRAPGGAPAPAPAPVPAPLTYEQQVAKLKGDMMNKIKGDSFDADLIIHRPTKVPPGPESAGKENAVPEFKDVGSDFGPYAGKPGFPPAAAPLKHDDISFKTGSLPVDAAHKNRETMTSDWHLEYGPNGPKGMHGARPQAGNFQPLPVR